MGYVGETPGPKIVVTQDLDKPNFVGSVWGEVNASINRAFGCVGAIVDGCVRDIDEVNAVGFKLIAARLCRETKIILIILAYLTFLFPIFGPLFGSSGSEPIWQFALLGLVGGFLWSLPIGTVRLIRFFL